MNFKEATDRLTTRVTADDIADAFGVARNTIARARLDAGTPGYRSPPRGWQSQLARLASERSQYFAQLAEAFERLARQE
jgi:hypothetical protein